MTRTSDQIVRWATIDGGGRKSRNFQKTGRIPHRKNAAKAAKTPERERSTRAGWMMAPAAESEFFRHAAFEFEKPDFRSSFAYVSQPSHHPHQGGRKSYHHHLWNQR